MATIKRARRDTPFVQIDKTPLHDKELSWKAKGLLAYLLSLPDDWKIYQSELQNHATDGKDSTSSAIKELIEAGYMTREKAAKEDGKFTGYNYTVAEKPQRVNRSGKTVNGKPATTNKDNTNNKLTNNERVISAREEKQTEPEIIQPLNAEPNPSKKVAPQKVSTDYHALAKKAQQMERNHLEGLRDEDLEIINSKTPESWIEAVEMCCEYFKTELGVQELKIQCRSAGVEFEKVDIRQVLTQFFGKKKSQPLVWMNPMNYTASLTAWIKTEYSAKPRYKTSTTNQKPNALKIINNDKYAQYEAEWRAEQERRKASA